MYECVLACITCIGMYLFVLYVMVYIIDCIGRLPYIYVCICTYCLKFQISLGPSQRELLVVPTSSFTAS